MHVCIRRVIAAEEIRVMTGIIWYCRSFSGSLTLHSGRKSDYGAAEQQTQNETEATTKSTHCATEYVALYGVHLSIVESSVCPYVHAYHGHDVVRRLLDHV